jgi:DNA processing protein
VTSSASAGCHVLLRGDAVLVDRAAELVEIVGRAGEFADIPAHPVAKLDALSRPERVVYEALPARGYRSVEQIAVDAALAPESVLGPLALLEASGLVQRKDGRWQITPG